MAEGSENSRSDGYEMNTLGEALSRLGVSYLFQHLDGSLMQVRQHKKGRDEHLQCLKQTDKRLLKLSISYHPDRIANTDQPDAEVAKAQELQAALNAVRTVLPALTEVFLDHMDIDFKYEYFSDCKIDMLLSDEQRGLLIGRLSNKLRRILETKQDVVIGEVRKFLLKSRRSIKSFLENDAGEFKRYRDHAIYHLEKCVEGYKTLASECSIVEKECKEGYLRHVIQKAARQSASESNILSELLTVARQSIRGPFLIYSIRGATDEYEYSVLPFAYYIFILLTCSLMVDKRICIKGKSFPIEPPFYEKSPDLYLTAHYLSCYFNDRICRDEVELILKEKDLPTTEMNVVKAFHDNLKKIDCFLAEEFKIEHYDAGKSPEEQLDDRLTRLTEARAEFEEVGKDLLEKIRLCRVEYDEIRKTHLSYENENRQ